jgi:hypothetical protein
MIRIMSEERQHPTVISLSRNDVFYARHAIPSDAERYAHVTTLASGETRLIMRKNCIVVVEDLRNPHMRADLVLFIREDRSHEGAYSLWFAKPEEVPDLREALTFLNIPQAHVVTGVTDAVIYGDEMLVPDYGKRGPYGWIIKREDVSRYIAVLPKGRDSGHMDQLYIWREIHVRAGGESRPMIRIEGWSKYPDPIRDNVTLKSIDEYVVVYDTGSRVIKEITITNASVDAVSCDKAPLRGIQVGRRLPTNLGREKW